MKRILIFLLLLSLLLWGGLTWTSQAFHIQNALANVGANYTLSGRVYEGTTGLEPPQSTPIQGAAVSLYCSNNANEQGTLLRSTTTDSNGWYGLAAYDSDACEYYNIIETDPPGYESNGASSVDGNVITANWIQYSTATRPLSEQTLTGNKFWDQKTSTPTSLPTNTPTPTDTPTPTFTPTPTGQVTITPTITATPTPTSSCAQTPGGFDYRIDPELHPRVAALPGIGGRPPRPMAAVLSPDGSRDNFVVNQVILYAPEPAILNAFINAYDAEIVAGGLLPPPPSITSLSMREGAAKDDYYLLTVNLNRIDPCGVEPIMEAAGFDGLFTFSSLDALRLSALIAKERVEHHLNVTPDILMESHDSQCVLCDTEEELTGSVYQNGFGFWWVNDEHLQLGRAWQYFDLLTGTVRPWLAILDGGFSLNADFPANMPQYDLVDDDNNALGTTGNDWHGTEVLSVAAAAMNNRYGSVGSGAQAARPMIFRISKQADNKLRTSLYLEASGIKTATYWGASVINISYGGECGWWCRNFGIFSGMDTLASAAKSAGLKSIVTVVSAGNETLNLDSITYLPCETSWTLCVGALSSFQIDHAASFSNYGSKVDIWAPGQGIDVTHYPGHMTPGILPQFSGTSAAAPYIAGIVTLMKAVDLSVDYGKAGKALQNTANSSTDSKVKPGYVNAYAALKAISAGRPLGKDSQEPNDTAASAYHLSGNTAVITGTIAPGDHDYYAFNTTDYTVVTISLRVLDWSLMDNELWLSAFGEMKRAGAGHGHAQITRKILPPGRHVIGIWGVSADSINCYRLSVNLQPAQIKPDRFDDQFPPGEPRNDTFAHRVSIPGTVTSGSLLPTGHIYNVNFHVTNDIDFYQVTLGPATDPTRHTVECPSPPPNNPTYVPGRLIISAYPNWSPLVPSYSWPFEIKVYDDKGNVYKTKTGYNLWIDCPHKPFPQGIIRFSVRAKNGRRNFYQVDLAYQHSVSYPDMPLWVWERTRPPLIIRIIPALGAMTYHFPADPAVIDQVFNGEPPAELPTEFGIMIKDKAGPLDVRLTTQGGKALVMRLYDREQHLLAQTAAGGAALRQGQEPGHIHLDELPAGTYIFAFGPGEFDTTYTLRFSAKSLYLPLVAQR